MAAVDQSPNVSLNNSLGLSSTLTVSPMNLTDQLGFLVPERTKNSQSRFCSPLEFGLHQSPNISPIPKSKISPSDFIRRRDLNYETNKQRCRTVHILNTACQTTNSNLDETLSVKTILKDLKLLHLKSIFDKEEINLSVFFTLNDDDLKTICIDEANRKTILDFISNFSTPQKQKNAVKNVMFRH